MQWLSKKTLNLLKFTNPFILPFFSSDDTKKSAQQKLLFTTKNVNFSLWRHFVDFHHWISISKYTIHTHIVMVRREYPGYSVPHLSTFFFGTFSTFLVRLNPGKVIRSILQVHLVILKSIHSGSKFKVNEKEGKCTKRTKFESIWNTIAGYTVTLWDVEDDLKNDEQEEVVEYMFLFRLRGLC